MTDEKIVLPSRHLSPLQRKVLGVLKHGGLMYGHKRPSGRPCHRVVDVDRNPKYNIGYRTYIALVNKERIERNGDGHWVYKQLKRRRKDANA